MTRRFDASRRRKMLLHMQNVRRVARDLVRLHWSCERGEISQRERNTIALNIFNALPKRDYIDVMRRVEFSPHRNRWHPMHMQRKPWRV